MRWNSDTIPGFIPSASNGYSIDWDSVYDFFPIIKELSDVPQNPDYHGEGDVLTHTRMVVEALTNDQRWRELKEDEQAELWLAALLHDIGKAKTTIEDDEGALSAPNHTIVGSRVARELMYTHQNIRIPFENRERIVNYIRYHGLPIWLLEKENHKQLALLTSQMISLYNLYLLASSDVEGRICKDKKDLQYTVELFREFCITEDCFYHSYSFTDSYTQFVYANQHERDPSFPAYDETKMEMIMLSGLPGAGKDTWMKNNGMNMNIISLDEIRREKGIAATDNQGRVIQDAKEQARLFMRQKQPFVWNATNITRHIRNPLIDLFLSYNYRVKLIYLECPYNELIERNKKREHSLPQSAILKMIKKLEVPKPFEAHCVEYLKN